MMCKLCFCKLEGPGSVQAPEFVEEAEWRHHLVAAHEIVPFDVVHVRAKTCPPSGRHPTLCGLFSYRDSIRFCLYEAAMGQRLSTSTVEFMLQERLAELLGRLPSKICGECASTFADDIVS